MKLTDIQVQALRLAAGHHVEPLNPKNNSTVATLQKHGLLTSERTLTDAGHEELRSLGFETQDVLLFDEAQHGTTVGIDPGTPTGLVFNDLSTLSSKLLAKVTKAHRTATAPIERRRAKNRTGRKSRRVNRQRAK